MRRGSNHPSPATPASAGRLASGCRGRRAPVAALAALLALFLTLGGRGAAPARAATLADAPPTRGPASVLHPYMLARVDNAVAAVSSPGALAARPSTEIVGLVTDTDGARDGDWAVLVKKLGLAFSYERYQPIDSLPRVGRLTIATGQRITRALFAGTSYAWYFSKDDDLADLTSVDVGVLARWAPRLSVAAVATALNRPSFRGERIETRYALGVGFSPFSRLVLFAQDELPARSSLSETAPAFGVELEPVRGLVLRGAADTDGESRFGLEYNLAQSAYGVVGRYDRDGRSDGRAGYLRLTDEIYTEGPRPGARRPRPR